MKQLIPWILSAVVVAAALSNFVVRSSAAPTEPPVRGIDGVGEVVPMPEAAEQPRAGTKILVDVTAGGDPKEVHPALVKAARFVNVYARAGAEPTRVRIALALHGDATTCVLGDEVYATKFGTKDNPSSELIRTLHEAGVELFVCGQALSRKGFEPGDVPSPTKVAVSALTVVANKQADGYAYVLLP